MPTSGWRLPSSEPLVIAAACGAATRIARGVSVPASLRICLLLCPTLPCIRSAASIPPGVPVRRRRNPATARLLYGRVRRMPGEQLKLRRARIVLREGRGNSEALSGMPPGLFQAERARTVNYERAVALPGLPWLPQSPRAIHRIGDLELETRIGGQSECYSTRLEDAAFGRLNAIDRRGRPPELLPKIRASG